jgi:Flp pilus assembly protein TadD
LSKDLARAQPARGTVAAAPTAGQPAGISYLRAQAGLAEPAGYELGDAGLADPGYRDARPADPKRADPERADPKRAGAGQADAGQATQTVSGEAFLAAAEQATQAANWTAAEQLWRSMRILVPHMWYAHTGGATALCGLGRFAEARLLLSDAMTTFPWEHTIRHELGRLDARLGDWPAAEAHCARPWSSIRHRGGCIPNSQVRSNAKVGSDAEEVLLDGQVRDPNEITLFTYAARLAWARRTGPSPSPAGQKRAAAFRPWRRWRAGCIRR